MPSRAPGSGPGPLASPVPLCVPNIGGNERTYVEQCLTTGWGSSVRAFVERFEREFAAALGVAHAVATNSGTAAPHTALPLAGVRRGDGGRFPFPTPLSPPPNGA